MKTCNLIFALATLSLVLLWVQVEAQQYSNLTRPVRSAGDDRSFRLNQDKKEIIQYLSTKNVIKTMLKLLFGTTEESVATSRQVLSVFVKMLELLKSTLAPRARSSSGSSRVRDAAESAAQAGISMLQGYVKSVLASDKHCVQRSICEGAANAARESRELGGWIAHLGGYATSYVLENQRGMPFSASIEAVGIGKSGADCRKAYKCELKEESLPLRSKK